MEKIVLEISSSSDESDKENSSPLRDPEILTYHIQPSITLKESDYERLDPEKYLNDNLVDFFIR